MNKFYLYSGLAKMHENQKSPQAHVFHKALDVYENELMLIFNCSEEWPICLYDFTYKNKIPQYLCFKTESYPSIIEDHFTFEEVEP